MRVAISLTLIIAFSALPVQAQTPSRAATISWIVNHLPTHSLDSDVYSASWERLAYRTRGCSIIISDTITTLDFHAAKSPWPEAPYFILTLNAADGTRLRITPSVDLPASQLPSGITSGFTYTVDVNLKQIDLTHITIRKATNHAEWGLGAAVDGTSIGFPFHGADGGSLAARVMTAFRHAIRLCGGTGDVF